MSQQPDRLIAVTGASGFIGRALLNRLLDEGWRVRILTRDPKKWAESEFLDVFTGDLVETRDWTAFLEGVDVLIHAAAEIRNPDLMMEVNVQGPQRLLHAAVVSGVRRWVQLSSVGAYGTSVSGLIDENTSENPVGPYEKTKTLFDHHLKNSDMHNGLQICIVRPSNVYGAGMSNQSLFQMMKMIRKGWFFYIGPPGASANYVHVSDVVNAVVLSATLPQAAGKTYNVSDWTTIEKMAQAMASGMRVMAPNRRFSFRMMLLLAKMLKWVPRWPLTEARVRALSNGARYSTQLISEDLGWRVSVPVERGMQELTTVVE